MDEDQAPGNCKRTVLIIDDDEETANKLSAQLQKRGLATTVKIAARDALQEIQDHEPLYDIVVFDFFFHEVSGGAEINDALIQRGYDSRSRILFTKYADRILFTKYNVLIKTVGDDQGRKAQRYFEQIASTGVSIVDKLPVNATIEDAVVQLAKDIAGSEPLHVHE
jgi:CheY-like chemotaxis protein